MNIKVTKMQGCGNDFVVLDYDEYKKLDLPLSDVARKLCNRNFGIGGDGLIIPYTDVETADIAWLFCNSDGTTAQMCGNGMRCFAKYVYDNGLVDKKEFSVKTLAGTIIPKINDDGSITVNMSKPILKPEQIPFLPYDNLNYKISVLDKIFQGSAVSMGNPHFVIYVDSDEDILELAKKYGSIIETMTEFPEKTNVEFVKIKSMNKIEMCVWERGCGITLACGTGACASVVIGVLNKYIENSVDVVLLGGAVRIDWKGSSENTDKDVYLTGPANYVFNAEINI
ncbi:MAG: diaminopimelate epimerase [bacterium]|nr:diaminopimelate epimerase [bacterium]